MPGVGEELDESRWSLLNMKRETWKILVILICVGISIGIAFNGHSLGQDLGGGIRIVLKLDRDSMKAVARKGNPAWTEAEIDHWSLKEVSRVRDQALLVIEKRFAKLKLSNPSIGAGGDDRIVVSLDRRDRVSLPAIERLCQRTGRLSVHLVNKENDSLAQELLGSGLVPEGFQIEKLTFQNGASSNFYVRAGGVAGNYDADALRTFHTPPKFDLVLSPLVVSNRQVLVPYFIEQQSELSDVRVDKTAEVTGESGRRCVKVRFDLNGRHTYRQITEKLVPRDRKHDEQGGIRFLGVVVDGRLLATFPVMEVIYDGNIFLDRIVSDEEGRELGIALESGPLPGRLSVVEELVVPPGLGTGAIWRVLLASCVGGLAVLLLLAAVWRAYGVAIGLSLLLQFLLLPLGLMLASGVLEVAGGMSGGHPVLSLPTINMPGLAGLGLAVVIAMGMMIAVIQRIFEELRSGKVMFMAMASGYQRMSRFAINLVIAQVVAGVTLFLAAKGPMQNFAVGLCGGAIVSLFVVPGGAKTVLELLLAGRWSRHFGKAGLWTGGSMGFIRGRVVGIVCSGALILGLWAGFAVLHWGKPLMLGMDLRQVAAVSAIVLIAIAVCVSLIFKTGVAVAALIAAATTVLLSVGGYSLVSSSFNAAVCAALATVCGFVFYFSLAICDRIAELQKDAEFRKKTIAEIYDAGISRSLPVVLVVVVAVLLMAFCMAICGAGGVSDVAMLLGVGVVSAAWSAVFIMPPALMFMAGMKTSPVKKAG